MPETQSLDIEVRQQSKGPARWLRVSRWPAAALSGHALGFSVIEKRRKIKPEFANHNGPQLVALKKQGIDFDSADGEPVDIVIGMLLPDEVDEGHRADVRLVTEVLADEALRDRLRNMNSSTDLYDALIQGAEDTCQANCA